MPVVKKTEALSVLTVVGARPNFVKIASFIKNLEMHQGVRSILLHTGQHYDASLSDVFFEQLGIRKPDINLEVGSGSHAQQTAAIMTGFEKVLEDVKPSCVVVVGDVNSTLACSITAKKMQLPVVHIEAGLRSFDLSMPEEINRMVTDRISDLFFTTSRQASEILKTENVPAEKIHFVGNLMIDSLYQNMERAKKLRTAAQFDLIPGKYALLTLHRPSNVDDLPRFKRLVEKLKQIHAQCPILFLAHPRTWGVIEENQIVPGAFAGKTTVHTPAFILARAVGYLEMLNLQMNAAFVMTDSGGIQEETTVLGIPCLTLRDNTERPETETEGTNQVIGGEARELVQKALAILGGQKKTGRVPELWDGHTGERIVEILLKYLDKERQSC